MESGTSSEELRTGVVSIGPLERAVTRGDGRDHCASPRDHAQRLPGTRELAWMVLSTDDGAAGTFAAQTGAVALGAGKSELSE
jgi:hypothetical protein